MKTHLHPPTNRYIILNRKKVRFFMPKKFLICGLCMFFTVLCIAGTQAQAACSFRPVESHPVPTAFYNDAECLYSIMKNNVEFAVMCELYSVPEKDKMYNTETLKQFRYHFWERFGYVDWAALVNATEYKEKDGRVYIYLEPVFLQKLEKTSISKEKIRKIIKKLKITSKTSEKTACYRIAKWLIQNFTYDERGVYDFSLSHQMKTKKIVCHGYASLFYALAKECGIDVHYVSSAEHAYNYIILNGKKYYYDVTNADTYDTPIKKEKKVPDKTYLHQKRNMDKGKILDEF